MGLLLIMAPFISSTALLASSGVAKHTKPKPLLTFLRSFMTRADVMVPCLLNSSRRRASSTVSSRFFTYRLTPWNLLRRSWRRASYCSRSSRMRSDFFCARPTNRRRTKGLSSFFSSPSAAAAASSPSLGASALGLSAAAASAALGASLAASPSSFFSSPSSSSSFVDDAAKVASLSSKLRPPSSAKATPLSASTAALASSGLAKLTKPKRLLVPSAFVITTADTTSPYLPISSFSLSESQSSGRFLT
mmetsp:Transcript_3312/g.12007  ORF Transcript_3312/g.12007 Transcript_3312/m.12007 type:complete len:248 (+) Transcript_3312:171-914(+)